MKKLYLLTKTLLAAAMLAQVGEMKAQVEVYDLDTWSRVGGTSFTSSRSSEGTTTTAAKTVYVENGIFHDHSLNGRFGFESGCSGGSSKGYVIYGKNKTMAILNLKKDDIVIIEGAGVLNKGNYGKLKIISNNVSYYDEGVQKTITAYTSNDTIVSGRAYTMTSDGTLDLSVVNSQAYRINKLTIATSVTLGTTGYATYGNLTGATLALPAGLKAYVVNEGSSSNKDVATLEEVSNIPAGTGVILKGTAGETYTLSTTADAAATFASNNLVAVTSDMTLSGEVTDYTNFLLGEVNDVVAFYRTSGTGTLKAGKAYLHYKTKYVTTGSEARGISIVFGNGETTGINTVNGAGLKVKDSNYYDLQGRRVTKPTRGLYIVNGKKVVIN